MTQVNRKTYRYLVNLSYDIYIYIYTILYTHIYIYTHKLYIYKCIVYTFIYLYSHIIVYRYTIHCNHIVDHQVHRGRGSRHARQTPRGGYHRGAGLPETRGPSGTPRRRGGGGSPGQKMEKNGGKLCKNDEQRELHLGFLGEETMKNTFGIDDD